MKKIFLSLLILVMSIILFSPNVHAEGDPGFTVYAFDGTETTHTFTDSHPFDPLKMTVYADGELIYDRGTYDSLIWEFRFDLEPDTISEIYFTFMDLADEFFFSIYGDDHDIPSSIANLLPRNVVIIVSDDPDSFNAWGYEASYNGDHTIPDSLDLSRTTIFLGGEKIFENGVDSTATYSVLDNRSTEQALIVDEENTQFIIYSSNNSTYPSEIYNDTSLSAVIIEAAEPSYEPIFTIETLSGDYDFIANGPGLVLDVEGLYSLQDIQNLTLLDEPFIINGQLNTTVESTISGFDIDDMYIENGIIKYDDGVNDVVNLIWVTSGQLHIDGLGNQAWEYYDYLDVMPVEMEYIYRVPGITGTGVFITNVDAPIAEEQIRASLVAYDEGDGDITDSITKTSDNYTPNKNTVGEWDIVYSVQDSSENTVTFTVTVFVRDIVAPTVDPGEFAEVTITYGSDFNPYTFYTNFTITDNYDDLEDIDMVDSGFGIFDGEILGDWPITYTFEDQSGNSTTVEIMVTVVDDVDPVITGPDEFTTTSSSGLTLGTILTQYSADDEYDGVRTNYITVVSNTFTANKNTAGVYEIVLNVTDLSGNVGTKTIEVTVTDDVVPVFYITRAFISVAESITLTLEDIIRVLYITGQIDSLEGYSLLTSNYFGHETEPGVYNVTLTNGVQQLSTYINVDILAPVIYAIQFNSSGGTFISTILVNKNQTANQPEDPVREGYKFDGWYRDSMFITKMKWDNQITDDMVLYAKWVPVQSEGINAVTLAMIGAVGLIVIGGFVYIKKKAR